MTRGPHLSRNDGCRVSLSWGDIDKHLLIPDRAAKTDQSNGWLHLRVAWGEEVGFTDENVNEGLLAGVWVTPKLLITEKSHPNE